MSVTSCADRRDGKVVLAAGVVVDPTAIIGMRNPDASIFASEEERTVWIGEGSQIGPWSLIYEGATLESHVIADVRAIVGSRSKIGRDTRLYYGAQVHDHVEVGEGCIIGGFIADNCRIGAHSSVFGDLIHRYAHPGVAQWDEVDEQGPTLGEGVIVGWGALLIGAITIGSGARIAPRCIVRANVGAGQYVD